MKADGRTGSIVGSWAHSKTSEHTAHNIIRTIFADSLTVAVPQALVAALQPQPCF